MLLRGAVDSPCGDYTRVASESKRVIAFLNRVWIVPFLQRGIQQEAHWRKPRKRACEEKFMTVFGRTGVHVSPNCSRNVEFSPAPDVKN